MPCFHSFLTICPLGVRVFVRFFFRMDCLDYTTHLDVDTIMHINSNCNLLLTQRKNKHTNKLTLLCWNWSTKPKYWRILCHSDISIEFKWAWIELHLAAISYFRVLFLLSFQVFNPITQTRYVHLQKYNNGLWCLFHILFSY